MQKSLHTSKANSCLLLHDFKRGCFQIEDSLILESFLLLLPIEFFEIKFILLIF